MAKYRVLVGIEYASRRAEPGDVVVKLNRKSLKWLTDSLVIGFKWCLFHETHGKCFLFVTEI